MYHLGDHFKVDYKKARANENNIIQGDHYRFTVLTERLVRLEYSEEGIFEDRPTELVWYRNFPDVSFEIKEDDTFLELTTSYFRIYYTKEKPFRASKINPMANLKVELLNSDRVWYYGHPEVRNYGTTGSDLFHEKGTVKFHKGLYSLDGFVSIDDSKHNLLDETGCVMMREHEQIDLYLFCYLKNFDACLKDYFQITGFPALIPRFALGNWWSKNCVYDDRSLKDLIDRFDQKEIPLSILMLESSWHQQMERDGKSVKSGFTWNLDLFHSPSLMSSYLHSKGIRLGLSVDPSEGLYPNEQYYNQALEYLQADENGVIPFQVLNPKFIDVYLKLFIHPLDSLGADFFWIHSYSPTDLHSLFLLNHYHFYDMMRNYQRRPMVLSRNSMLAAHRYPVLYSGKTVVGWDTLKKIPLHNSSAANMGVSFWSHDIGGYYKGIEDNELYTRFVQLGVFSPILKFGADASKYYKREPWKWSIKTYEIVKDYLQLRHRMIPYLYTESYKYHQNGIPLVQPIYYKYPEMFDDVLYRNEYYFGSEMFVCPIISKKDFVMNRVVHKFFLPDGMWYDFVTGKKFPGGRNYISFFRDEDYPVFARSGSIIPFGENDNLNDTTPPKNMEIHIFPGQSNLYRLYEDDGVSDLYKRGYFLKTSIDYNYLPNNYTVIIRALEGKSGIVPEKRNYKIRFRNTKRADDVIAYFNNDQIEYEAYNEGPDFVVDLKDVPTIGQLTLNCKGRDIEIDAVRLINEDVESIISDLQIETLMKEKIDHILFSDLTIKKKRIEIRKLGNRGLERKFVKLFLRLLEYIEQV